MVEGRDGVTGGLTISDALREFEARGYVGQFTIQRGGTVECTNCGTKHRPRDVTIQAMRRVEGPSDPADMAFIGALVCPQCGTRGTAVVPYGPNATQESAEVLRELHNERPARLLTERYDADPTVVRDTGWLRGPDG